MRLGTESGLHLRVPGQLAAVADLRHPVGGRGRSCSRRSRRSRCRDARWIPTHAWRDYAALGESYFYAIIGVELTLVMLAAPAATAGAICVDRARGTLTHMLVTDLTDPEIVLGKLAARLLPILGLVACTWPVLAICSLLGGIDPTALTLAFAIILAVALLGCTMALALSVWARKPHEVVLVTYTFWILVLLFWPIWFALSLGAAGRPTAALESRGQSLLPGVRPLFRAGPDRFLGLSRLLRRWRWRLRRC